MTGGSDTREKTRAVFLAFVMITSVFGATVAFSGSAAANAASISIGNQPDNIALSSGQTQTVQVSSDQGSEDDTYTIKINVTDLVEGTGISSSDVSVSLNSKASADSVDSGPTLIQSNNTIRTVITDNGDGSDSDSGQVQFTVDITVDGSSATAARGVAYEVTEDAGQDGIDGRTLTNSFKIGTSSPSTILVSEYGGSGGDLGTALTDSPNDGTIQVQDRSLAPYQSNPTNTDFQGVTLSANSETIESATGTPTIDGGGSEALVVTGSSGDVTLDGLELKTDTDGADVIRMEGNLLRNGGTSGSSLTVRASAIRPKSTGSDAFAIEAKDGSDDPVAIDSLTVENTTIERTDSATNREIGINIQDNSGSVSINGSTFNNLAYAFQGTGTDGLQFTNNDVTSIATEGVILNTGSSPVDFDPQANVNDATITDNDFDSVSSAGVVFIDPTGAGSSTDFQSGTYSVNDNNFTSMSDTPAVATDTDFSFTGDSNVDISVTIDASNNFYGSELGPEAQTGSAASGSGDVRNVPDSEYNANAPALIQDDGDVDFRPFRVAGAPDGESVDFDFNNNFNQQTADARSVVNATFTTNVDESSIDIYAVDGGGDNGFNQTLVENGELVANNVDVLESTLDNTNDTVEQVSINTSVQETSDLTVKLRADDESGNNVFSADAPPFDNTLVAGGSSGVDMAGDDIVLITDDTNPAATNPATFSPQLVDRFDNDLALADGNENVDDESEITVSTNDPGNVSRISNVGSEELLNQSSGNGQSESTFQITYSDASELDVTVTDTGSTGENLGSTTATQLYTAQPNAFNVTVDDDTLPADGSSTINITAQIIDSSGDPVQTQETNSQLSLSNSTAAGITIENVRANSATISGQSVNSITTFQNGTFTAEVSATNLGETIAATATDDNGFSGSTTFTTTGGAVDAANSQLSVGGSTSDSSATVASDQSVLVTLEDAGANRIEDVSVELSSNSSDVSFASTALTTNASGQASTTVTLPEQKGTVAINASAGDFNASGTGNAQVNVSTQAENASALQFASDTRTLPANTDDVGVSVEVVDEFGNVNESVTNTVTLTSSDASVFDFDGSESTQVALSSGAADFSVDVNESGTATLDATVADANITNTSADFSVGSPNGVEVTFSSDVSTSSNSATNGTATVTAQLTNDGDAIGIGGETISFARQSGEAAELNQSANDFEATTDSTGAATFQVNATDTTGDTTFLAIAGNFSAQGTGTITTTGAASTIDVAPANSTIASGNETTVTATFADSQGRTVPRTSSITLQAGEGQVNGSPNTTEFVSGVAQATFTFNATNVSGGTEVTLTAVGGGVTGDATVTIEAADVDPVERFDTNGEPGIQDDEVLNAISAFNEGEEGVEDGDVLDVISAFNEA